MSTTRIREILKDLNATLLRQKRHQIWLLPNGNTVVVSNTPSDHRAEQNAIRDIRKAAR